MCSTYLSGISLTTSPLLSKHGASGLHVAQISCALIWSRQSILTTTLLVELDDCLGAVMDTITSVWQI